MSKERYAQPQPATTETNKTAQPAARTPERRSVVFERTRERFDHICPEKSALDKFHMMCCAKWRVERDYYLQMNALAKLQW